MYSKHIRLFTLLFFAASCAFSRSIEKKLNKETNRISIEVRITNKQKYADSVKVEVMPLQTIGLTSRPRQTKIEKLSGGKAALIFNVSETSFVRFPFLPNPNSLWICEPGDEFVLIVDDNGLQFFGKSRNSLVLQYQLKLLKQTLSKSLENYKGDGRKEVLRDYFDVVNKLNLYEKRMTAIVDSAQNVSKKLKNRICDEAADVLIDKIKDYFVQLNNYARKDSFKTLTRDDLCTIYDSTVSVKIKRWLPYKTDGYLGSWWIPQLQVRRNYRFDFDREPLNSTVRYAILFYQEGSKMYKDKPRTKEQFRARLLTELILHDIDYTPEIQKIVENYYSESEFPKYKKYVREYEAKGKRVMSGERAPEFTLTDKNGKKFSSQALKGKVVLMDFWFTGCVGCIGMAPVLKRIENEFKGDTNVVFLSISVDKEKSKWLKSLAEKKYTTGEGTNLFTNGNGSKDYMLDAYMVSSYPTLFLLNSDFRIIKNPLPSPMSDKGEYIISLIRKELAELIDGPYVLYDQDIVTAYTINNGVLSSRQRLKNEQQVFPIQIEGKASFDVKLKRDLQIEPSEFARSEKLITLSDIEGNFEALTKLLQANRVIDQKYNWIFGNGHLVFAGDMFDRGDQVTACLWLLYSLEEKAKVEGGYVHFILGNHEIMNLSGDHRYARPKYKENANLMGKSISNIYNSDSELGRWLRTKNIIEKIGDLLFLHAGVSPEVNKLSLDVKEINELARPYYDRDSIARKSGNKVVQFIYDAKYSPFWYRMYYQETPVKRVLNSDGSIDTLYRTPIIEIDNVLNNYKVSRIITGHTIVADTISVHHEGKVINTDTDHAKGKSEALLIEGDKFYRVNDKGQRWLLLDDSKKRTNVPSK